MDIISGNVEGDIPEDDTAPYSNKNSRIIKDELKEKSDEK